MGCWVETGTYTGNTTEFLAQFSPFVISIEPGLELFENASKKLANYDNILLIKGESEDVFPELLPTLTGDFNFWLDGHYSSGITFLGKHETPITFELDEIAKNIKNFNRIAIFVDDVRSFCDLVQPKFENYPPIDILVDFANKLQLSWYIEHDIFIAKNL